MSGINLLDRSLQLPTALRTEGRKNVYCNLSEQSFKLKSLYTYTRATWNRTQTSTAPNNVTVFFLMRRREVHPEDRGSCKLQFVKWFLPLNRAQCAVFSRDVSGQNNTLLKFYIKYMKMKPKCSTEQQRSCSYCIILVICIFKKNP